MAIWLQIATDNEAAADRLIDALTDRFQMLAAHPEAGRSRDDVRVGYRGFPVGNYQIFYRIEGGSVDIVHVTHGARKSLA